MCFIKDKDLPVIIIEIKRIINKRILEKYSEKVIYEQKCNELLLYGDNWVVVKDLVPTKGYVYGYLEDLSEPNPEKFLKIYEQYKKRVMERSKRDYEEHKPFTRKSKAKNKILYGLWNKNPLRCKFLSSLWNK